MSTLNFNPAVNKVENICYLDTSQNQYIVHLQFELNGIHKLIEMMTHNIVDKYFHIYVFVIYYQGNGDFEIVTSAQHRTRLIDIDDKPTFETAFLLPEEHPYGNENFVDNYYTIEMHYSERSAEDGSDINMMLGNSKSNLFSTKLIFEKLGD